MVVFSLAAGLLGLYYASQGSSTETEITIQEMLRDYLLKGHVERLQTLGGSSKPCSFQASVSVQKEIKIISVFSRYLLFREHNIIFSFQFMKATKDRQQGLLPGPPPSGCALEGQRAQDSRPSDYDHPAARLPSGPRVGSEV